MESISIDNLIADLAIILTLGAVATVLMKLFRQPLVLGYIVAGFLASPHFSWLPSVATVENIEFWAQIGIIVLLFSLGLEFSFKKLLSVGGSAAITTLIIVGGMLSLGFVVGKLLGFSTTNSLFLGGMLSTSSTTIIIKALDDLGMRQRRFVPMIFAVLIVEDIVAVVMMVLLSSVAKTSTIAGGELLNSILVLLFYLVMWFTIGIFVIPSTLQRFRRLLTDEMMLIISMALCFLMAMLAVKAGFSMALGAFVMGSILAGTIEVRRIERVVTPVKDLFGAVFFISVGMMVNPEIIVQYWPTILLLAVVVIVGMITFGTFGMLATGQPLKIAIESGFTLTQIGEFSFIIATLGTSLGVLSQEIYPIIVAVSVLTVFTTPFFIKLGEPAYNVLVRVLPNGMTKLLDGYSDTATQEEVPEVRRIWRSVLSRYCVRSLLYTVVGIGVLWVARTYVSPVVGGLFDGLWHRLMDVVTTLILLSPILYGLLVPSVRAAEEKRLVELSGYVSYVPMTVMSLFTLFLITLLIAGALYGVYNSVIALVSAVVIVIVLLMVFSPILRRRVHHIEQRFVSNANQREDRRTGHGNNLVNDLQLAYMLVGHDCPFVGQTLRESDIRRHYGVSVVSIERAGRLYSVPRSTMRVFPGDVLGVIGTEAKITAMLPYVEAQSPQTTDNREVKFLHFALGQNAPIVGRSLAQARLREDYDSLLVAVQRGSEGFLEPDADLVFAVGDVLWIVGNPKQLSPLR